MSKQRYEYSDDIEAIVDNGIELTIQDVMVKLNQHENNDMALQLLHRLCILIGVMLGDIQYRDRRSFDFWNGRITAFTSIVGDELKKEA